MNFNILFRSVFVAWSMVFISHAAESESQSKRPDFFLPINSKGTDSDANPDYGNDLVGYWNFSNGMNAIVGSNLEYLDGPDGRTARKSRIGEAGQLGVPFEGNETAQVLYAPRCLPGMGYLARIKTNASTESSGFINQFTVAFRVYFPVATNESWRALLQTTVPHYQNYYSSPDRNLQFGPDGDLFIDPSNGVGILGSYDGMIEVERWTWIVIRIVNGTPTTKIEKFIDSKFEGVQWINPSRLNKRWCLPYGRNRTLQFFSDDDGETNECYVDQILLFSGLLNDEGIRRLVRGADPFTLLPESRKDP